MFLVTACAKNCKKNLNKTERPTVGASIIEGLKQAISWTRGENRDLRGTLVHLPKVDDAREVRTKMGLSQEQPPNSGSR